MRKRNQFVQRLVLCALAHLLLLAASFGQSVQFAPQITIQTPAVHLTGLAVGDFNNDGIPDVFVPLDEFPNTAIALGKGDGRFGPWRYLAASALPNLVAVGDFNGDGNLDTVSTDSQSNAVTTSLGLGDGSFCCYHFFNTAIPPVSSSSVPVGIKVVDVNGDGIPDLIIFNYGRDNKENGIDVSLGNGDGTFQAYKHFSTRGTGAAQFVMGDFNGDGILDFAATDCGAFTKGTDNLAVLLGNGDGTFKKAMISHPMREPNPIAVGDFNGDGILDLAVASIIYGRLEILLGRGDGTFYNRLGLINQHGLGIGDVKAADFNGDGKLDLAVLGAKCTGCYADSVSILLGNGDGTFQAPVRFDIPFGAFRMEIADLNSDGKPDILVVNSYSNTLNVLLNTTP